MRFIAAVKQDVRYQARYGFYFLYAFFTILYILALRLCPAEYRVAAGSIVVLTDPAMLGCFFIGGIWLLEKEEGLHGFFAVSPLRPWEYMLSKVLSLGAISVLSGLFILYFGLGGHINYFLVIGSVLAGSGVFTLLGLVVASYAHSVNHYMLLTAPLEIAVAAPPLFIVFGISHPALILSPGTAVWRLLAAAVGIEANGIFAACLVLILWLAAAILLACKRLPRALEGGTAL